MKRDRQHGGGEGGYDGVAKVKQLAYQRAKNG